MSSVLLKSLKLAEIDLENSVNGLGRLDGVTVVESVGHCEQHGEYKKWSRKLAVLSSIKTETVCPKCAKNRVDLIKQQIDDELKQTKNLEIDRLMSLANITPRFKNCTFENYYPPNPSAEKNLRLCRAFADKWLDRLKNGGGMVMIGSPGTGKNHLAVSIVKTVIEKHQHSAVITSVNKIIREFRSTWGSNSAKSETDVINHFSTPQLLVIDEVGVQYGTNSEQMIIFEIINTRYEQMRPTILISNETRERLAEIIGERVIDRMRDGGGGEIVFNWESYRQ